MNVTSIGRTDHNSVLIREAEAQSYTNRSDMKKLMQSHIDDNLMSDHHANGIKEFAETRATEIDYNQYKYGSTFVPVEIAMIMKESCRDREVIGYIDDDIDYEGYSIPEYNQKFKRI